MPPAHAEEDKYEGRGRDGQEEDWAKKEDGGKSVR